MRKEELLSAVATSKGARRQEDQEQQHLGASKRDALFMGAHVSFSPVEITIASASSLSVAVAQRVFWQATLA